MSKNLIRTGFLVLALAAALLVSVLLLRLPAVAARASAAQQAVQTEATQPCWRVCVRGTGRAVLYSSQGDWMQNLTFYNGETLTMAIEIGKERAAALVFAPGAGPEYPDCASLEQLFEEMRYRKWK